MSWTPTLTFRSRQPPNYDLSPTLRFLSFERGVVMSGSEIYEQFMALHTRDGGLVMPNAWDGLSALVLADAGFEAIATSSLAIAATLGRLDGRHEVTREEHLEHARLLGRLTGLPVNGDFEDGYGDMPED